MARRRKWRRRNVKVNIGSGSEKREKRKERMNAEVKKEEKE